MAAIQSGAHEQVQELLKDGVEVNFMDYDKRTPLHLAAAERNADIARCLVEAGADVNSRDRWGSTPLQDAYLSNSETIVKMYEACDLVDKGFFRVTAESPNLPVFCLSSDYWRPARPQEILARTTM